MRNLESSRRPRWRPGPDSSSSSSSLLLEYFQFRDTKFAFGLLGPNLSFWVYISR